MLAFPMVLLLLAMVLLWGLWLHGVSSGLQEARGWEKKRSPPVKESEACTVEVRVVTTTHHREHLCGVCGSLEQKSRRS